MTRLMTRFCDTCGNQWFSGGVHCPSPNCRAARLNATDNDGRVRGENWNTVEDLIAALKQIATALDLHPHWQPTMPAHLAKIARDAIAAAGGGV